MAKILQFKIILKESDPKIWRRFLVKDTITFHDLHLIIQIVMGWENDHLYHFRIGKREFIGIPDEWGDNTKNAKRIKINSFFVIPKAKLEYEYDFGDSWYHELSFEKFLDQDPNIKYPVCIAGEGACPPEDCGGVWGYYNMLEALKDKKHPEHKTWKEWIEEFDPETFDINEVNSNLPAYKKYDAFF